MKIRDAKVHPTRQNKDMEPPEYLTSDLPAASEEQSPGRKTLFNPEYVHLARVMVEAGLKYSDLARAFNVNLRTIKDWMKSYPTFGDAIVEAQDWFNTQLIEKSLVRRATGYDYSEDTYEAKPDKKGTPDSPYKMVLTKRVKKHVAPSERAIEYYLNNRSRFVPDAEGNSRWAHTNKLEVTGPGGKELIPDSISPEKLLAELISIQKVNDEVIDAEIVEAKRIGVDTGEALHDEANIPDAR